MLAKLKEEMDKGLFIPLPMLRNLGGAVGALAFVMAKHPRAAMANIPGWMARLRQSKPPWGHLDDESKYDSRQLLSPEDYENLPPVRTEKYLRPTRLCESEAPEIRAMAIKLGGGVKSDLAFTRAVYEFVKNEKKLVFKPMRGALGTFRSKGGVCLDQLSLMAALLRAGGVSARYRLYALAPSQQFYDTVLRDDLLLSETLEMLGFLDSLHGETEALVDGKWIPLDSTFSDELEAGMGLPITSFGEEPTWRDRVMTSDIRFEGFPLLFRHLLVPVLFALRTTVDVVNEKLDMLRAQGLETIDRLGREEYNKQQKSTQIELPSLEEVDAFRNGNKITVDAEAV
ncbi:MAG: transglutaminase-like domain-containing protein [Thermoplasmatota archaeon]